MRFLAAKGAAKLPTVKVRGQKNVATRLTPSHDLFSKHSLKPKTFFRSQTLRPSSFAAP